MLAGRSRSGPLISEPLVCLGEHVLRDRHLEHAPASSSGTGQAIPSGDVLRVIAGDCAASNVRVATGLFIHLHGGMNHPDRPVRRCLLAYCGCRL